MDLHLRDITRDVIVPLTAPAAAPSAHKTLTSPLFHASRYKALWNINLRHSPIAHPLPALASAWLWGAWHLQLLDRGPGRRRRACIRDSVLMLIGGPRVAEDRCPGRRSPEGCPLESPGRTPPACDRRCFPLGSSPLFSKRAKQKGPTSDSALG